MGNIKNWTPYLVLLLLAIRTGIASARLEDIRSSSAGLALEQRALEVQHGVRHCQGLRGGIGLGRSLQFVRNDCRRILIRAV